MKLFALLGEHLSHSYSPIIQNRLFELKGLDYKYELKEIAKDEIKDTLELLRKGIYSGYNVTIPYKKEVMQYLDEISDEAKAIGAVNTIKCKDGKLIGYNTDYYGFSMELNHYNINVSGKRCYVLGTGGASLAVKKALVDLGAIAISVSRTKSKDTITYDELDVDSNDIIVNTTPLGMYPNVNASALSKDVANKAFCIVDIIFNPSTTLLMSYNKNSYNGLLMLIGQAAKAQDIWLDKEVAVDLGIMKDYVEGVITNE